MTERFGVLAHSLTSRIVAREQIEAARSMVLSAVMASSSVMNLALNGD